MIRRAERSDWRAIWAIFQTVIAPGDSFVWTPDITEAAAQDIWFGPGVSSYVAITDSGTVVGAYLFEANQPGLGSHVANAAFMVAPDASGRGIGRTLGEHCLREAKAAGFLAMQFNIVVATNERAVALWQSLGFAIVGTLPQVFRHQRLGLVDAYVMHRFLDDQG